MHENRSISNLEALLEAERSLLLSGQLDGLSKASKKLENALMSLENRSIPQKDLGRLRVLAQRNQALISAALEGLRNGQARIQHLKRVSQTFSTYDKIGHRVDIQMSSTRIEKKF